MTGAAGRCPAALWSYLPLATFHLPLLLADGGGGGGGEFADHGEQQTAVAFGERRRVALGPG